MAFTQNLRGFKRRFNPRLALFAASEQGGWWDPSDLSSMFQDSAGTTPVTATGQPVGKINDKSGRGNHRTQATAGARPTLQRDANGAYYLQYDGVGTFMLTGSINFSATNKMTAWTAWRMAATGTQMLYELSTVTNTNNGSMNLFYNTEYDWGIRGTVQQEVVDGAVVAAPNSSVLSVVHDMTQATINLRSVTRRNGALDQSLTTGGPTTAGNFGNFPIYFGSRGGTALFSGGSEYGTIIRGATSTAQQVSLAESFLGRKIGIAL